MMMKTKAPSLVDLCVRTAIDNIRYLGDVGETDIHLLGKILPHCTLDQLIHIEKSNEGRDLSPVTDDLWKKFYEMKFGSDHANLVIERMKKNNVDFRWMQIYEAKLKDMKEALEKSCGRMRQRYQKEIAEKQSRQIQICNKVPPNPKRGFWSSFGGDSSVSNTKSNLMKKAKKDFLKCQEVKNLTAMKRNAIQRHPSISPATRPGGSSRGSSSSTSKQIKPPQKKRFF